MTTATTTAVVARKPAGWKEWLATGLLLAVHLRMGYGFFTVLGLVVAVVIVTFQNRDDVYDAVSLKDAIAKDNNWVFYALLGLAVMSFLIALFDPSWSVSDLNPITYGWETLKNAVSPELTNPWANDGVSSWLTWFFLGEDGSWIKAAISYAIWTALAYPVIFWDDWKAKREAEKAKAGHRGGLVSWLWTRFVEEGIGEALWHPIKKVFGIGGHTHKKGE